MNIHNQEKTTRLRVAHLGACLAISCALLLPGRTVAQVVNMDDGGSTASIDLGSSAGMNSWTVNGQNQLNQQWFWYRTGNGVAAPINSIGTPTVTIGTGANGNNEVTAVYQNSQLSISVDYFLTGGGAGTGNADITESIIAVNKTSGPLSLNFYQYSNFNLLGAANDTVQIFGGPGNYNFVRQANGATALQEAVTAPSANYAEAALLGQTLNELSTVAGLNLNSNSVAGPGNVTWALQWEQDLTASGTAGDEFDLTKDKSLSIKVIPEPASLALLACGVGALGFVLRRKKA